MMTLKRFRTLADSYGADFQRWPERLRPEGRRFLESSAAAQEIMSSAGELDRAIVAAGAARRDSVWSGESDAAFVRLRNSVGARIRLTDREEAAIPARATSARAVRNTSRRFGWFSLATAASVAILAGVLLGVRSSPPPPQQDVLALLQPAPVQLLGE
jgi:hypothetical protein